MTSVDLPEPLTPVTQMNLPSGNSAVTFLRLLPRNAIEPIPTPEEKEKFKAAQKAAAEKKAAAAKAAAEKAAAEKAAAPQAE